MLRQRRHRGRLRRPTHGLPGLQRRRAGAAMSNKKRGRPIKPCGTVSAYKRHHRNKETPCQPCKDAFAAYKRSTYVKKGSNRTRPPGTSKYWHQQQRDLAYHEYVKQWKLAAGKCVGCGFEINERTYVCIDCDHRDPSQKTFTISYEVGRKTMQELQTELDKCDPVCRNCHALRTHDNKHWLARRPQPTNQDTLFDV